MNRGDDQNGSDYDVLVVFEKGKKNFRSFIAVSDLLEEPLGASVDMVTREGLSPRIGPNILKETEYVPIAGSGCTCSPMDKKMGFAVPARLHQI